MSKPKWTPGLWEIQGGAIWQVDGSQPEKDALARLFERHLGALPGAWVAFFEPVAMVASIRDDPDVWLPTKLGPSTEVVANGHLIAAAPELYDALEDVIANGSAAWERADAVLVKARGGVSSPAPRGRRQR